MFGFLRKWRKKRSPQYGPWGIEVPLLDCPGCSFPGDNFGLTDSAKVFKHVVPESEVADAVYREYGYPSAELHWRSTQTLEIR